MKMVAFYQRSDGIEFLKVSTKRRRFKRLLLVDTFVKLRTGCQTELNEFMNVSEIQTKDDEHTIYCFLVCMFERV